MKVRFLLNVFVVGLGVWGGVARAERPSLDYYFSFPHELTFSEAVPTPEEHLGFQIGEWHLRNDQIVSYIRRLAEMSDRMQLVEYGRSHEEKPVHLLKISVPRNLDRIGEIKDRHARGDRGRAAREPVVLWLGYSIHGNESSGANAVPLIAYFLAAAEGDEIEEWLENMVILIDPVLNPDGLDRFAHWANIHRGKVLVADPNHREHTQGWPTGRFNHYWFDLNRDWLPLVHPESRGRMVKYHEWLPHVLCDYHEMGTNRTYFFQPGVPERNNPLTPDRNFELTARIAEVNADILDGLGAVYFTREIFDDFYAGKGSTYPDLNGSIGILFEQGSSRGHLQESPHGLVSFPFTIRNQVATSFGTIRATLALRDDLKSYQHEFFEEARREAGAYEVGAYVIELSEDPVRNFEFLDLARQHRIRLFHLARDVDLNGERFAADRSVVAPLNQRQYHFVRSFFEARTEFEDQVFYDISTWSVPPAFNLRYAEAPATDFSAGWLGSEIGELPVPEGRLIAGDNSYAYLFSWDSFYAPRALYRLLSEDIKVRMAPRPIVLREGEEILEFDRGTILVPVGIQPERAGRIREILTDAVALDAVDVYGVSGGLAVDGLDLGSPSLANLEEPSILMAVGPGIATTSVGAAWHFLDWRMEIPVSLVEVDRIGRIDLSRYNTIVLPNGSYGAASSGGVDSIRTWLRQGNTLIAFQQAAEWAIENNLARGEFRSGDENETEERFPYAEGASRRQAERITGAIFRAHVDSTHPIGFGYRDETVALFRQGTRFLELSSSPYQTPVRYDEENARISGYASDANLELLNGSAATTVSFTGSGRTVLFMDDLNFRGYWLGAGKLLMNAIFFGPAIESGGGSGEDELD